MGFYATDTLESAPPQRTSSTRARRDPACSRKPHRGPTRGAISGYRYYSPSLARWPNRDPIEEIGGENLYSALLNNPFSYVDPHGLIIGYNLVINQIGGLIYGRWSRPDIPLTDADIFNTANEVYSILQNKNTLQRVNLLDQAGFDTRYWVGPFVDQYYLYNHTTMSGSTETRRIHANELNYLGIGMYNAWRGMSVQSSLRQVRAWKFIAHLASPSIETIEWTVRGMQLYHQIHNSGQQSVSGQSSTGHSGISSSGAWGNWGAWGAGAGGGWGAGGWGGWGGGGWGGWGGWGGAGGWGAGNSNIGPKNPCP